MGKDHISGQPVKMVEEFKYLGPNHKPHAIVFVLLMLSPQLALVFETSFESDRR